MNINEIKSIPLHHLMFEDVKGLTVDELVFLRIDAIDTLTSLEIIIDIIKSNEGDWHKHSTVKSNLKRVIGTFNGIIASRNRANNKITQEQKERLKKQHIKIVSLESEIKALKRLWLNKTTNK